MPDQPLSDTHGSPVSTEAAKGPQVPLALDTVRPEVWLPAVLQGPCAGAGRVSGCRWGCWCSGPHWVMADSLMLLYRLAHSPVS